MQIISQFFYAAGSIIPKSYSSTAQNAVALLCNPAAKKENKKTAQRIMAWVLILLGVALGIFNNRGLLGWLPIVANPEYSVAVSQRFGTGSGVMG